MRRIDTIIAAAMAANGEGFSGEMDRSWNRLCDLTLEEPVSSITFPSPEEYTEIYVEVIHTKGISWAKPFLVDADGNEVSATCNACLVTNYGFKGMPIIMEQKGNAYSGIWGYATMSVTHKAGGSPNGKPDGPYIAVCGEKASGMGKTITAAWPIMGIAVYETSEIKIDILNNAEAMFNTGLHVNAWYR